MFHKNPLSSAITIATQGINNSLICETSLVMVSTSSELPSWKMGAGSLCSGTFSDLAESHSSAGASPLRTELVRHALHYLRTNTLSQKDFLHVFYLPSPAPMNSRTETFTSWFHGSTGAQHVAGKCWATEWARAQGCTEERRRARQGSGEEPAPRRTPQLCSWHMGRGEQLSLGA